MGTWKACMIFFEFRSICQVMIFSWCAERSSRSMEYSIDVKGRLSHSKIGSRTLHLLLLCFLNKFEFQQVFTLQRSPADTGIYFESYKWSKYFLNAFAKYGSSTFQGSVISL